MKIGSFLIALLILGFSIHGVFAQEVSSESMGASSSESTSVESNSVESTPSVENTTETVDVTTEAVAQENTADIQETVEVSADESTEELGDNVAIPTTGPQADESNNDPFGKGCNSEQVDDETVAMDCSNEQDGAPFTEHPIDVHSNIVVDFSTLPNHGNDDDDDGTDNGNGHSLHPKVGPTVNEGTDGPSDIECYMGTLTGQDWVLLCPGVVQMDDELIVYDNGSDDETTPTETTSGTEESNDAPSSGGGSIFFSTWNNNNNFSPVAPAAPAATPTANEGSTGNGTDGGTIEAAPVANEGTAPALNGETTSNPTPTGLITGANAPLLGLLALLVVGGLLYVRSRKV